MPLNFGNPFRDRDAPDDRDYEQEDRYCFTDKIEAETAAAWAIMGTDGKTVWLPKSQVTMDRFKTTYRFTVPAWLARRKETLEFD